MATAARVDMRGVVVDVRQVTDSEFVPSHISLVVFGSARISFFHKVGMPFAKRFKAPVHADEEMSQA